MLKNRPLFLKQLTWFCLIATLPYQLLWIWEGRFWLMVFGFIGTAPLLLNIYFLAKKNDAAAAFNIILFGLINIWIYDDGIGGSNGFYFYFFSELIGVFLLFDRKENVYRNFALLSLLAALVFSNLEGFSPKLYNNFPGVSASNSSLPTLNFFMSLICSSAEVILMIITVRKAEDKLTEALKHAEDLAELKSQFLSNMSHELRTPMNAVVGLTDVLLKEQPRIDQQHHLEVLKFSSNHLLHIINDILDYSRIEAGGIELEEREMHLAPLLRNLHAALLPLANEKHLDLRLDIDSKIPPALLGDANRITQILNNLLNNALKFTHEGWVRLQVICLKNQDGFVDIKFTVTDTGIGISKDKSDLIFERFTQASADTTRKYGGTGLGLAICKKLLGLLGSEIHLQSEAGLGSEFSFELRLKLAEETPRIETPISTDSLRGRRILLAEDNAINQLVARNYLEEWGVDLKVVSNGQEAVNHLGSYEVDLVLMDLQMPEMDGYQASRHIREMENGRLKQLPIIALTASSKYEVGEQYRQAGMNDFVHKPFNPVELYAKMASFLPV